MGSTEPARTVKSIFIEYAFPEWDQLRPSVGVGRDRKWIWFEINILALMNPRMRRNIRGLSEVVIINISLSSNCSFLNAGLVRIPYTIIPPWSEYRIVFGCALSASARKLCLPSEV